MDGVISLPIALAGYFMYPDFPHNTRAWYINENVRAMSPIPHKTFSNLDSLLGQGDCKSASRKSTADTTLYESEGSQDLQVVAHIHPASFTPVSFLFPSIE
jgi:hypothetical protein